MEGGSAPVHGIDMQRIVNDDLFGEENPPPPRRRRGRPPKSATATNENKEKVPATEGDRKIAAPRAKEGSKSVGAKPNSRRGRPSKHVPSDELQCATDETTAPIAGERGDNEKGTPQRPAAEAREAGPSVTEEEKPASSSTAAAEEGRQLVTSERDLMRRLSGVSRRDDGGTTFSVVARLASSSDDAIGTEICLTSAGRPVVLPNASPQQTLADGTSAAPEWVLDPGTGAVSDFASALRSELRRAWRAVAREVGAGRMPADTNLELDATVELVVSQLARSASSGDGLLEHERAPLAMSAALAASRSSGSVLRLAPHEVLPLPTRIGNTGSSVGSEHTIVIRRKGAKEREVVEYRTSAVNATVVTPNSAALVHARYALPPLVTVLPNSPFDVKLSYELKAISRPDRDLVWRLHKRTFAVREVMNEALLPSGSQQHRKRPSTAAQVAADDSCVIEYVHSTMSCDHLVLDRGGLRTRSTVSADAMPTETKQGDHWHVTMPVHRNDVLLSPQAQAAATATAEALSHTIAELGGSSKQSPRRLQNLRPKPPVTQGRTSMPGNWQLRGILESLSDGAKALTVTPEDSSQPLASTAQASSNTSVAVIRRGSGLGDKGGERRPLLLPTVVGSDFRRAEFGVWVAEALVRCSATTRAVGQRRIAEWIKAAGAAGLTSLEAIFNLAPDRLSTFCSIDLQMPHELLDQLFVFEQPTGQETARALRFLGRMFVQGPTLPLGQGFVPITMPRAVSLDSRFTSGTHALIGPFTVLHESSAIHLSREISSWGYCETAVYATDTLVVVPVQPRPGATYGFNPTRFAVPLANIKEHTLRSTRMTDIPVSTLTDVRSAIASPASADGNRNHLKLAVKAFQQNVAKGEPVFVGPALLSFGTGTNTFRDFAKLLANAKLRLRR